MTRNPMIPALPLPPTDAKWKRQSLSVIPVSKTEPEPVSESTPAPEHVPTPQPEPVDESSVPTESVSERLTGEEICARAIAILNAPTVHQDDPSSKPAKRRNRKPHKHAENRRDLHNVQDTHDELSSTDAQIESHPHHPLLSSTASETESPSPNESVEATQQPAEIETNLTSANQSSLRETNTSSAASVSQYQETEGDLSRIETVVNTTRQVRLQEPTSFTEPEVSSIHPSSNPDFADYNPTPVDSSLEAVADSLNFTQKMPIHPNHRKSEAAPEVLTNGHASHQHSVSRNHSSWMGQPQPVQMSSIFEYFAALCASRESYDVIIQVNSPDQSQQQNFHYAHALLLLRSPRMSRLLSDQEITGRPRMITLSPVRHITAHAFDAALRYFYTDEILYTEPLIPRTGFTGPEHRRMNFNFAISYWFAGLELGMDSVKRRAAELIGALVDWEIVETVMREVQDLEMAADSLENNSNSYEIRNIGASLFTAVIKMMIDRVNRSDFKIDPNAQVRYMFPRFVRIDPQRMLNNPALTNMVFGSLPAPAMAPTGNESQISAILLNMGYIDLVSVSDVFRAEFGSDTTHQILEEVIKEREAKRDAIISNRAISNQERLANAAVWEVAGWKESVREGRLSRERVGFVLPTRNSRQVH